MDPRTLNLPIQKITGHHAVSATDHLAVEEPLEIRISYLTPKSLSLSLSSSSSNPPEPTVKPIAITMRTPGRSPDEDFELALGFLYAEAIIKSKSDVNRFYHCGPETAPLRLHNVVRIELASTPDLARLERHFYTTSSCGVCGKTSMDAIRTLCPTPIPDTFTIPANLLHALPEFLRDAQSVFDTTGGLHAAALFDLSGKLLTLREDVGRHNALDKIVGQHFLADQLPLHNTILLLSGRASFELLQKAIMAQIPIVAAIGAPSSLAAQLASQFNVTLAGFLRNNRFNLYSAPQRIHIQ
jgi:FdhD protein